MYFKIPRRFLLSLFYIQDLTRIKGVKMQKRDLNLDGGGGREGRGREGEGGKFFILESKDTLSYPISLQAYFYTFLFLVF